MRKVLFKKFIAVAWVDDQGNEWPKGERVANAKQKPGTNQWEDDFTHPGLFHGWGYESESRDVVDVVDSYAIIELPDGTIDMVLPRAIKFTEPYEPRPVVRGEDIRKFFKPNPAMEKEKVHTAHI